MTSDTYAITAGAYDLFSEAFRPAQTAALEAVRPRLQPNVGPILDIGAGSGYNTQVLLETVPDAHVIAVEPSRAMRALLLSRIAGHPQWYSRVTVRPESFLDTSLPAHLGGAVLLGVLGHFDPIERAAVLAELAARLPSGGVALLDLQEPERPQRVEAYDFTAAEVGDLTYRGIAEAWPVDGELMRWRMTYLSVEGDRVLTEETADYEYRHPSPAVVAIEAAEVGLLLEHVTGTFWVAERV